MGNRLTNFDPSRFEVVETLEQQRPAIKPQQPRTLPANAIDEDRFETVEEVNKEQESYLGKPVVDSFVRVGQAIDSVTGAPTRSFIERLQAGKGLGEAFTSAFEQFGKTTGAPTGRQIAQNFGVSNEPLTIDPSMFGPIGLGVGAMLGAGRAIAGGEFKPTIDTTKDEAVGFMVDLLADPTNVIPGTAVMKGVGRSGVIASNAAAKGAKKITPKFIQTAVKSTGESLSRFFTPKVAPDFSELVKTGEKLGISQDELGDVIEFGEMSMIGRADIAKRATPAGEGAQRAYLETWQKAANGLSDKVVQISGGNSLSASEAGELIRAAYRESAENILNSNAVTYRKISQIQPDLRLTDKASDRLDSLIKDVVEDAEETLSFAGSLPASKKAAQNVLDNVTDLRNGEFSGLEDFTRAMQNIGKTAFANKGFSPDFIPDLDNLKRLYFGAREALLDTYKTKLVDGEDLVKQLESNNKALTEFFTDQSVVARVIENPNIGPEKVFNSLMLQDTRRVEALKNIIDPTAFDALKATAFNNISGLRNAEKFSFPSIADNLRKKPDLVKKIFDADELAELGEILKFGERLGPVKLSPPAAGVSGTMNDIMTAVQRAILNDAIVEQQKAVARYGGYGQGPISSKAGQVVKGTGALFSPSQEVRFTTRDFGRKTYGLLGAQSQPDNNQLDFGRK